MITDQLDKEICIPGQKHKNSMPIRFLAFMRMQSGEESKDVIKARPVIALSMRDINEDTIENMIDWMSIQTTERSHSSFLCIQFLWSS